MIWKPITSCRACGSSDLVKVFSLGDQPLANDFRFPGVERFPNVPLEVMLCLRCTLGQLSVVVDPKYLYHEYAYTTPGGPTNINHLNRLIEGLETHNGLGSVLEIGSNDGLFLDLLRNSKFGPLLGVDPSVNVSEYAREKRKLNIRSEFFSSTTAPSFKEELGKVDYVVARHVFCHIEDWHDLIAGIEKVCHEKTLVAIEVPSTRAMLFNNAWDMVYHEHLSYMTAQAMETTP